MFKQSKIANMSRHPMINAISSVFICFDDRLLLSLSIQKVMPGAMSLMPLSPPNVSVAALKPL